MFKNYLSTKIVFFAFAVSFSVLTESCKKKHDDVTPGGGTSLRPSIDYAKLTPITSYTTLFVDEKGDTTVDRNEGRILLNLFRGLSAYSGTALNPGAQLDSAVFENMFANKNNGYTGTYAYLNGNSLKLSSITSSSKTASVSNEAKIALSVAFGKMAKASSSRTATASQGSAGLLYGAAPSTSKYLVDEKGIEWAQIIQKSLIGAVQLDYICNVLLDQGLNADNSKLVAGKKYTELEHNWDVAYGFLTVNNIFCDGATDAVKNSAETLLGSYVWEYNKGAYSKIHSAFLKGRAAIVNNDKTELKAQADYIRREFEKAIASSAIGYLNKWKSGTDDASRAHAYGEGIGFIYSLRYCKMNGADEAFSDGVINGLGFNSGNGFWDLTTAKANTAISAIQSKFAL